MAKKSGGSHDNRNAGDGRYESDKQAAKHPTKSVRENRDPPKGGSPAKKK
jgi:hypothetical protein